MHTVGLIVEYNPFHNGHLYHLQQAKKVSNADAVVAVMSGYFLQRGEPALVDKWARTEMALCSGVDLVLELPVVFSCHAAEWFAYGAVATLEATGIVDSLCFGSESGDIQWMKDAAKTITHESESFQRKLHSYLKKGLNYPRAYAAVLEQSLGLDGSELAKPNNILGLNYLKALNKLNSAIEPLTIRREKANYHQTEPSDNVIASATTIRHQWLRSNDLQTIKPFVPDATYNILLQLVSNGREPVTWETFHQALISRLITSTTEQIQTFYEVEEGLEYRLKNHLPHAETVTALLTSLKTKRYTWNRLQRMLAYILLGLRKEDITSLHLEDGPTYLRVLGFTETGRQLLKRMRDEAKLPVITRIHQDHPPMLDWDLRAAALYALATQWKLPYHREFYPPVYIKSEASHM